MKTKMIGYREDWDSVSPERIVENSFRLLGRREKGLGCVKHELIDELGGYLGGKFEARNERIYEKVKKIKRLRERK